MKEFTYQEIIEIFKKENKQDVLERMVEESFNARVREELNFEKYVNSSPQERVDRVNQITKAIKHDTSQWTHLFPRFQNTIDEINANRVNALLKGDTTNTYLSYVSKLVQLTDNAQFKEWGENFRLPYTKAFYEDGLKESEKEND